MNTVFNLPDLGEGLTESVIVAWLVAEGDHVTLNQPLAEVETAKAVVEVPSPHAGIVSKLHAEAGEVLAVGAPLVEYIIEDELTDDGSAEDASEKPIAESVQKEESAQIEEPVQKEERLNVLVGSVVINRAAVKRTPRAWSVEPFVREADVREAALIEAASAGTRGTKAVVANPPVASPPVRAYAKQKGLNLSDIATAGKPITRSDIDAFVAELRQSQFRQSGTATAQSERVVPVQGVRKFTAEAMTKSYREVPHATVYLDVDVTKTLRLLRNLKQSAAKRGTPNRQAAGSTPTFLSIVSRAVVRACKIVPEANARFDGEANVLRFFENVNLGIAMSTPRGLVVASVDEANDLDAVQIAERIAQLREQAMAGKLAPEQLTSSTVTISNVGVFGVDTGSPIINLGESLILALGAVRKKPWAHKDQIKLREIVSLAVSFDHRLIDGAEASKFITSVAEVIETPGLMLAKN